MAVGDIDNDGFPDLFITAVGGNHLFHNLPGKSGGRRFADITAQAGVGGPGGWPGPVNEAQFLAWDKSMAFGSSATFVDYNGDGRLDLFVCFYVDWSPARDLAIDASLTGVGRSYLQPTQFQGAVCKLYATSTAFALKTFRRHRVLRSSTRGPIKLPPPSRRQGTRRSHLRSGRRRLARLVVANDSVRNFFFHNVPGPNGGGLVEEGLITNVAYAEGRAPEPWHRLQEYRPGKMRR